MLDGIDALSALDKFGTISEAAVSLRLTQSAVSKRIQALERQFKARFIEPDGRRVKLTEAGHAFLGKAKPLLAELQNLRFLDVSNARNKFSLGISDSIASSWGPKALRLTLDRVADLELELHVHRSTLVIEQVRLGRYDLGLVTGKAQSTDLFWQTVANEPMVLLKGGDSEIATHPIFTIEPSSATWREVSKDILSHPILQGREFIYLESFSAAAQMAAAGFGSAVLPMGIAHIFKSRNTKIRALSPRVHRQIHIVSRKSVANLSIIDKMCKILSASIQESYEKNSYKL